MGRFWAPAGGAPRAGAVFGPLWCCRGAAVVTRVDVAPLLRAGSAAAAMEQSEQRWRWWREEKRREEKRAKS